MVPPLVCIIHNSSSVPRMLNEHDALKIYEFKIAWQTELGKDMTRRSLRGQSGPASRLFGVSSRTVRDIWNRQTWAYATKNLWSREPAFVKYVTDCLSLNEDNKVCIQMIKSYRCNF